MYALHTDGAIHSYRPPLPKLDSTVVLERLDSATSSSYVYMRQDSASHRSSISSANDTHIDIEHGIPNPTPVALDVSIRFGRIGTVMAFVVTAIVGLTVTFNHGVVLGHFDPTVTDATAQKQLLDDYNSYTGNVAALVGRPLEIFVALAVHVVVLRVLATSMLRAQISWKLDALTLIVSATIAYMISNGLNALNVQPQRPTIDPVISNVDLAYVPEDVVGTSTSTRLNQTTSESSPNNPIINTALRNLVLPRVPLVPPYCDWRNSQTRMSRFRALPDVVLEYGFSQRDWQRRLLQVALPAKQLRVAVSGNKSADATTDDKTSLPMSASLAAELFVYSMYVTPFVFPWTRDTAFYVPKKIPEGTPKNPVEPVSRVTGLLPHKTTPPAPSNETAEREWFLRESVAALTRFFKGAHNASRSNVVMEFSHVDISPLMRFDAFTIEIEVDPAHIADVQSSVDNTTGFNNVAPTLQCGPSPRLCMMSKPGFPLEETTYDPPAQVQVFGSCVNARGREELTAYSADIDLNRLAYSMDCDRISNTSLMVLSVGKRFVAEALAQNKTANASGIFDATKSAVVTNMRRVYTYTIARLSWELSDLGKEYHAECASDASSCQGLRFPLEKTSLNPSLRQEIIVGVDALPMSLVTPPTFFTKPRFLPLVQLHEPLIEAIFNEPSANENPDASQTLMYDALAGDPLFPHNIDTITWDLEQPRVSSIVCSSFIEERLQLILNNHMYIEHGLQTAYTAATFFLLQNGVVRDIIQLHDNRWSLSFHRNTERIALLASIPDQNAGLTLAGCAVLVVGLCSVIAWARASTNASTDCRGGSGALGLVKTPHVVARVMLDSVHFPPMFLHRRVIGATRGDGEQETPTVEGFVIDGISLLPPPEQKEETPTAAAA